MGVGSKLGLREAVQADRVAEIEVEGAKVELGSKASACHVDRKRISRDLFWLELERLAIPVDVDEAAEVEGAAQIVGKQDDDVRLPLLLDGDWRTHVRFLALFETLAPLDAPLDPGDGAADEKDSEPEHDKRTHGANGHDPSPIRTCFSSKKKPQTLASIPRDLYDAAMRRAWAVASLTLLTPAIASAGNSDEVNAGLDVTLTGGAVVATVYTGAALWYNPAGLARIEKPSLELTGVTINLQVIKNPGLITIDTEPQSKSEGAGFNVSVIPQAITFSLKLRNENLKLGVGLFNSSIRREFITEQATSPAGSSPEVQAFAGQNSRFDFFHISTGLAASLARNRKQHVLLGGAIDLVVATTRVDSSSTIFYDEAAAGQINSSQVATTTGFGFQLKAGVQWVPIQQLRIGLSVTAPTYVFAALERFATSYSQAPPAGTIPDDPEAQQLATGSEDRTGRGVWWGVEPGNLRFGLAYVGDWGWIEGDLVYYFRLRQEQVGLDFRGFLNGRIGTSFRVTRSINLGLGAFTDFSQVDRLGGLPVAARDVDFFGVHFGILYSNEEVHPDRQTPQEKEGLGLSVAIGIRYAHGRGDTVGLLVPSQYDPEPIRSCADADAPQGCLPVATKVNEIAINLGFKVAF